MPRIAVKGEVSMSKFNHNILCNVVLSLLVIVLLVLQFLPGFWTYNVYDEDGEFVEHQNPSIHGLVWWPREYEDMIADEEKGFDMEPEWVPYIDEHGRKLRMKDFPLNDVILMPAISIAFGALTVVFTILKIKKFWGSLFGFVVGLAGVIAYMTIPIFRMNPIWIWHLSASVGLAVVGGISLGVSLTQFFIQARKSGLI